VVIHHDIIVFSPSKVAHDLVILKAYVRYYNRISLNPLSELRSELGIFATDSDLMFSMMHVRWICLGNIYYSKVSIDLIVRDKFCWLIAKLVQRTVNCIKIDIFVLTFHIFQYRFRYLFPIKGEQDYLEMLTDISEALKCLVSEHDLVAIFLLIPLIKFFVNDDITDDAIKMYDY